MYLVFLFFHVHLLDNILTVVRDWIL